MTMEDINKRLGFNFLKKAKEDIEREHTEDDNDDPLLKLLTSEERDFIIAEQEKYGNIFKAYNIE